MANLATYGFLPWARQGVAARISEADTLAAGDGTAVERAGLNAALELEYTGNDDVSQRNTISKTIKIVGPGDVLGLNTKAIVRTEPRNGTTNYEANGLPYIEFYEEDFLWRYTPAAASPAASNTTRLRPWLALVVLKADEFILKPNTGGLPYISVNEATFNEAFHNEHDTWAFAHVHINERLTNLSGDPLQQEVNSELSADPDVAVSRLLCPRKLAKNTGYTAFLIPAFETGRRIGLGIEITGVKAQAPSWKKGAMPASDKRPFDFPVYYQWQFRTANFGDFESLVTILKPVIMEDDAGKMPMDIHDPGFNLAAVNNGSKVIGLEAALKPPNFVPDPWPANADDTATVEELKKLLNLSADLVDKNAVINGNNPFFNAGLGDDPLLVPPVYGVWHALISKLGVAANPDWIEQLNLDFRNRAAAGLGAKVVRRHQEDFMNRAWQQVDKVNEANKRIQQAALAKMVNNCIFKKHMINAGNDKGVMLTHSVQHLVKNATNTRTVQQDFIESRIPFAAKSAGFRKISRPHNKTERASAFAQSGNFLMNAATLLVNTNNIVRKFNDDQQVAGAVRAAVLKTAPDGSLLAADVTQSAQQVLQDYNNDIPNLTKDAFIKLIEKEVFQTGATRTKAQLQAAVPGLNIPNPAVVAAVNTLITKITTPSVTKNQFAQVQVTIEDAAFKELFGEGIHAKSYNDIILKDTTPINDTTVRAITTISEIQDMAAAYGKFSTKMDGIARVAELDAFTGVQQISSFIFEKINPAVTLARKLAGNIRIWQGNAYVPLQFLKPVMAYPEFPEAVYTYLLELSKNYILPNIDKLPRNSITLLANNQSFIEAFMAGLNHEMARELLWREYPTDQRGSYFRQFWSIEDNLFEEDPDPEKDKELKLDIKKMHTWTGKLGEHNPRAKSANLVLVVRGDLFKKYPNTMVYAQMAQYNAVDPSKPRQLKGGIDANFTKFPLFKAEIDPDITLFGFNLEEDEARGVRIESSSESTAGKNPGWFFILKERPGQIRFGLDDYTDELGNTEGMPPAGKPDDWNDLTWEHLVNNKTDLKTYHITFNKNITINNATGQPLWNSNAADMAAILYQDPVLFARHAAEMLPEE